MRRARKLTAVLAALAVGTTGALLAGGAASATPTTSQGLFTRTLLRDAKTTSAVKRLLRDGGGFVAPDIRFGDLTGDGRSDAIALVDTGGVAGAVALYVLSTDGRSADSDLRAVYRSQRLYRATVELAGGTLVVRTPRYGEGDDVCCPAKLVERGYAWSRRAGTLRLRSSEEITPPA